ncbi:DedA family protein [Candidatus Woesearchaeota archaeon]|nr:DedA family protein [Candidatus Woesearchaeota archaeon]
MEKIEASEIIKKNKPPRPFHYYTFGSLQRLYNWVLSWAESKYSTIALAVLAFTESSFFPIPPDVLQIALSLSKPKRSFYYAFIAGIFSVIGGILGYFLGLFFYESIGKAIISGLGYEQAFQSVGLLYKNNAFLAILAAAFTPIPYKVFTLAAGFWSIGLLPLITASIVGRFGRFFIVATLTYFFGAKVKNFIDKYFNWLSIALFLLIVAGYLAVKYLM